MDDIFKPILLFSIIAAGYLGFVWILIRWMRSRLFRRAQAAVPELEKAGARVLAVRPSSGFRKPAEVEFEHDGRKARFQVMSYGRDFIFQSIRLQSEPLPGILIRAESGVDRLGKSLGLNREVQIGDATFDAAAYIDSAASDDIVKRALASAVVRARILELLGLGYRLDLSSDGIGASRIRGYYASFESPELPALLGLLEAIQVALPRFEQGDAMPTPKQTPWILIASGAGIALTLVSFRFLAWVHPPMDDLDSLKAIGFGLPVWLLAMAGVWAARRGKPNAIRELFVASILLFFALPPLVGGVVFSINAGMDSGPVTTHTVQISSLASRDHEVFFHSWRPGRRSDKVGTSWDVYRTLKANDTIEIDTRPGALGWTWVPAVRKVP
ncbi:MAG: hypothetical protein ABJE95_28955 [Byssovorax sp.]